MQKLASLRNTLSMRANFEVSAEEFLIKEQNCGWMECAYLEQLQQLVANTFSLLFIPVLQLHNE